MAYGLKVSSCHPLSLIEAQFIWYKDYILYIDFDTPSAEDAVQRLVPCPHCIKEHRQSLTDIISKCHHFKFKDLTVAAILERKDTIDCVR